MKSVLSRRSFGFDFTTAAFWAVVSGLTFGLAPLANAQESVASTADAQSEMASWQKMVDRSVSYLRLRGQAKDGSFSYATGIGPTGLVVAALLESGLPPEDPMVSKGLAFLEKHVQKSGGIHTDESLHRNYDTCIAVVAFSKAKQEKYNEIIARAEQFVRGIQMDESEGKDPSDLDYGGAGYGKHRRPDLSNTSYLVDALKELGNGPEDEAIQKALAFVSRCQNLESPYNDSPHAAKVNDGGFYYTVANGGETKAGTTPNGGLRSYGSMTYAGLKSMIYAGLKPDDIRVQSAVDFLKANYSLDSNPGMGQQGLFYYYHTMAKALDALGEAKFQDANGVSHDWKAELRTKLAEVQQEDGSWVNPTTRWMEGDPNLVSAYALLCLKYCKPL
ncbi:MAG: prenyltransferase/squalene oxidase repeat-containing protein [Aureliella sp.]